MGVLSLLRIYLFEIETGKFATINDKRNKENTNGKRHPSEQVCTSCKINVCEDETHFFIWETVINVIPFWPTILLFLIGVTSNVKDITHKTSQV